MDLAVGYVYRITITRNPSNLKARKFAFVGRFIEEKDGWVTFRENKRTLRTVHRSAIIKVRLAVLGDHD